MIISDDQSTVYGKSQNESFFQLDKINDILNFLVDVE